MASASHPLPTPSANEPGHVIRGAFEERVVRDLLGPVGGEDETVSQAPRYRYLVGMLAPADAREDVPQPQEPTEKRDVKEGSGRKSESDHSSAGEFPVDDDEEQDERSSRPKLFPSSVGLSFAVEGDQDRIVVDVEWGSYETITVVSEDEEGGSEKVWKRHQEHRQVEIALTDGDLDSQRFPTTRPAGEGRADLGAVVVSGRARMHDGFWMVELFLRNEQIPQNVRKDVAWLFQPKLKVTLPDDAPGFVGRSEALGEAGLVGADESEQLALEVQYRQFVEFATGHGIAVDSQVADADVTRAVAVETSWLPTHEVMHTVPASPEPDGDVPGRPELDGVVLDMSELGAETDTDKLRRWMSPLAHGYDDWLETQADTARRELSGRLLDAAEVQIADAALVADKIREGIEIVCADEDALEAFRFANRVMHQQRIRTDAIRKARADDTLNVAELLDPSADGTVDVPKNRRWRPFQLAFVLLNLPELVDPTHRDRSGPSAMVDLLFFPTGGGKTEAYLGLTAFTFAIRRLHADRYTDADGNPLDGSDGVAVLMRYTLRLLTAQQFERAAAMVCAAEVERRDNPDTWGDVPFRLGMWVGSTVTPNDSEIAKDVIETARNYGTRQVSGTSPLQLTACPWCGHELRLADKDHVHHHGENAARRTLFFCPSFACAFAEDKAPDEGIPVVTVDEEVYRLLPTFLLGTVDKFAQIPWNGATRLLFGLGNEWCERHGWRTPDLSDRMRGNNTCEISLGGNPHPKRSDAPRAYVRERDRLLPPTLNIQDEFHLITGPLGSLAGLFETIVDELSSWHDPSGVRIRPKVIASTATIRRAAAQVRGVFDRDVRMFPPQVIDVTDTFYALQVPADAVPGRRYLGVCAPARRMKEIENRVFTTVMGAAQDLYDDRGLGLGVRADPYMTTVGYFSSIRELAGMRRLAGDELPQRLWRLHPARRPGLRRRPRPEVVELTSRVSSTDIRRRLDQLGVEHNPANPDPELPPVDLLLATNMISVGVDVPRLGNMVVVGQPKSTAEYVQASSRVGRDPDRPGVVVTIYNWSRPRDVSHYETFRHYHATFYRHVEALSVTPFADRALDRGLTAILVGLMRALDDDANANAGAQRLDARGPLADRAVDVIVKRVASVTNVPEQVDSVRAELARRLEDLRKQQDKARPFLAYEKRGEGSASMVPLLHKDAESGAWGLWTLPNSLRNTEPGVNVLILDEESPRTDAEDWHFPSDDDAEDGERGGTEADTADAEPEEAA